MIHLTVALPDQLEELITRGVIMKVSVLVHELLKLDQDAMVYLYTEEMGAPLRFLRTDGDQLYFQADTAHREGESHVYLCDYMGGQ